METAVSKKLVKINNLEREEIMLINKIGSLRTESHELESKKKQLDVSIKTLQVNFDDRHRNTRSKILNHTSLKQ